MSITTHGFGSTQLTTSGWGGFGIVYPDKPAGLCPRIRNSLLLTPQITGSEPAEPIPEIKSSDELTPKITGTKGTC
jgi:hypothetical protein